MTDIRFHGSALRPTTSFTKALGKAEKKGESARVYTPIPKQGESEGIQFSPDGKSMKFTIPIPEDLRDLVARGLIDLKVELPDGQLVPIGIAPDVVEKLKSVEKKERTELIHSTKMREQRYKKYTGK